MRFGGIVLVTALALGACSSDPTPKEPDPSTSTSAAPTPTATLPTMPAQASEDSAEGAAAFVKHYVDVFNYAAATGDVEELSRLSAPDCEPCKRYADRFREIYENGDRVAQTLWTLSPGDVLVNDKTRVTVAVDVNEGEIKRYRFNFDLSQGTPRTVRDITMGDTQ
jgi:thiol-disulfide isomerase/thioredoxin